MARNDLWKRYLDAGMEFTQMSRERAEAVVRDLVKAGEVRRKEAEQWVDDLLDRSRRNTEEVVALVRREVREQLENLGLHDAARRLGSGGRGRSQSATAPTSRPATTPAPAAPATKAAAKKSAAKKTAKKSAAKKSATGAKKAAKKTAKKSTKKAT